MRLSAIALISVAACVLSVPASAEDVHSCGDTPTLPTMFDVDSASVDDIKRVAAEYKAYQDENTVYIDCLKATSKSDTIQGMKKKKRKAAMKQMDKELQKTVDAEQDYADAFNTAFTKWKEKKMAASQ